ncbi:MAG: amidohydrolase family protein [Smithella sp.]|nr:amidohydrolase family protein [Smithella sp.]MDD5672583.1 amidohydrolase family protein [Chitinivibrionales bacterium]
MQNPQETEVVTFEQGQGPLKLKSGKNYTIIILDKSRVNIVIDCHSHIQSGATAPLPLIWRQNLAADIIRPVRSVTDFLAPFFFILGHGGKIQRLSTEDIGGVLADELKKAYGPESPLRKAKKYNAKADFFSPAIIMPMDMDYAHIAGFPPTSTMVYHEGKFEKIITTGADLAPIQVTIDGVYYYDRKNGLEPENKGTVVDVSSERPNRVWVFQAYKKQHDATLSAVKKNPWQLIPMFHYEPRRWRNPSGGAIDVKTWMSGPWDFPFQLVASEKNAGVFIGFKMYPPLGYKPLDPRLPHLNDFYARCAHENIPILAHCSPGGMTTHEAAFYHEFDKVDLTKRPERTVSCSYDPCTPQGYFFDNYVHPRNWRPVLEQHKKLKLCLAHYGGDEWDKVGMASDWIEEITDLTKQYENVYTDMSCFNLGNSNEKENVQELFREMYPGSGRYRHLQDKLMFGVDWYLTLLTEGKTEYKEFAESFFHTMVDTDESQWYRSTMVNPMTFYGFDQKAVIDKMHQALCELTKKESKDIKKNLEDNYKRIENLKDQVAKIQAKKGNATA